MRYAAQPAAGADASMGEVAGEVGPAAEVPPAGRSPEPPRR